MDKSEALKRLEGLVERIPNLQRQKSFGEEFTKWQHDARIVLKYVFPEEKSYIKEFDEISYSLPISFDSTPDEEHDQAFRSGLGSARAMLQARVDEVSEFWPAPESGGGPLTDTQPQPPQGDNTVFVIHGRQLLGEFHAFLRALGLKPLEWSNARTLTGKPNPYTWEVVDTALSRANAIVALLTPDDEARLHSHLWSDHDSGLEKQYLSQPRQNVLFEAGVAFGRRPERTVLIRVGSHRPMSDLAGHHILQLDDSPQTRQAVADALRSAGCDVDTSGSDWFKAGVFALSTPAPSVVASDSILSKDNGMLTLYKIQIRGLSDLWTASSVVAAIHSFFASRTAYLNEEIAKFLEKYPLDFREQVSFNSAKAQQRWSLDELKKDVDTLSIG